MGDSQLLFQRRDGLKGFDPRTKAVSLHPPFACSTVSSTLPARTATARHCVAAHSVYLRFGDAPGRPADLVDEAPANEALALHLTVLVKPLLQLIPPTKVVVEDVLRDL